MSQEPFLILLVEDNPAHAKLVRRGLERHLVSNRIKHVADGEEALDYLFRRGRYADSSTSPRPHVILLDLRLPKVDGIQVLNTIKSNPETKRIPVVILTTSEAEKDVTAAYDAHANAYLAKPVDFERFSNLMNDLGFFWLSWNTHPSLN